MCWGFFLKKPTTLHTCGYIICIGSEATNWNYLDPRSRLNIFQDYSTNERHSMMWHYFQHGRCGNTNLTSEINYCIPLILSHAPSPLKLGEPCGKQTHHTVLRCYFWPRSSPSCWGPLGQTSSVVVCFISHQQNICCLLKSRGKGGEGSTLHLG